MNIRIDETLYLEPLSMKHCKELYEGIVNDRDALTEFLEWVAHVKEETQIAQFIQFTIRQLNVEGQLYCAIMKNDTCIGVINMQYWNRTARQTALGYWLFPKYHRQGIMTSVVHDFCVYLFTVKKIHRIELQIAEKNRASIGVARNVGFQFEGVKRDAELLHNQFVNHCTFSLLKGELR